MTEVKTTADLDIPTSAEERNRDWTPAIVERMPSALAMRMRPEVDRMLSALLEATGNPNFDMTRLDKMWEFYEKVQKRAERAEFDEALARAQATFPIIPERGRIKMYSKALRARAAEEGEGAYAGHQPLQNTPYALWEDVLEGIMPSLTREGFSLSFDQEVVTSGDGFRIVIIGRLKRSGFVVETKTPPLQHDSTGSKNSIQAIKSTTSYGKSMVTGFLVSFASRGEDDGGQGGAPITVDDAIDKDQIAFIEKEIAETSTDERVFLDTIAADSLVDINQTQFKIACMMFTRKRAMLAAQAKTAAQATQK